MQNLKKTKETEAEQSKCDNTKEKASFITRIIAGVTAIVLIGIVTATIVLAFSGASQNVVFTLIFLSVAISTMIYGFLLMNRFLRARKYAKENEKE